jgi:hypothetical protein
VLSIADADPINLAEIACRETGLLLRLGDLFDNRMKR